MNRGETARREIPAEADEPADRPSGRLDREEHASFAAFLGARIRTRRRELTVRWVEKLEKQSSIDADDGLLSEDLLNHVSEILERIAGHVADPGAQPLEALVIQDLGRLAETRRRQGFGLRQLGREYRLLSELIRETAEEAAAEYPGSPTPREVAASIGTLMDGVTGISTIAALTFGLWRDRYDRERDDLLEIFEDIVVHELGNHLGAAEMAVQLLNSPEAIDEERRTRLCKVILESIRQGRQTVREVAALTRPFSAQRGANIALWLVVKESARLAEREARGSGISISIQGEIPDVKVPGPAVRMALSNLLENGIEHHRDAAVGRWVRVSARLVQDSDMVEITIEDNGPGIPRAARQSIFEYHVRGDLDTTESGLGLAITREVVTRVGGTISYREGRDGGALFSLRVPAIDKADQSRGP